MTETFRRISLDCPHCKVFQTITAPAEQKSITFPCGGCKQDIALNGLDQPHLETCPVCANTEFYQHKDFNKVLGFLIFIVGAVLVPYTYAISLIVALALDAALYPFFPWMMVCYLCKSEFRGWPKHPKLDRFNHEVAAHYEYGGKGKKKAA